MNPGPMGAVWSGSILLGYKSTSNRRQESRLHYICRKQQENGQGPIQDFFIGGSNLKRAAICKLYLIIYFSENFP